MHHVQTNRQAETAKRDILTRLKKRVDFLKGISVDELKNVLWAIRTTRKIVTIETLFRMVYDIEVSAPVEIAIISPKVHHFSPKDNDIEKRTYLDLAYKER